MPRPHPVLLVGIAVLLSSPAALAQSEGTAEEGSTVDVTADSPPEVLLAFSDLSRMSVPRHRVEEYRRLLKELSRRCEDSSYSLAQVSLGAVRALKNHAGVEVTNREFLRMWVRNLGGPMNSSPNCGRLAGSVMLSLGGDRIERSDIPGDYMVIPERPPQRPAKCCGGGAVKR